MEIKRKFGVFLILLLSISFTSSALTTSTGGHLGIDLIPKGETFNNNTGNVNNSQYLQGYVPDDFVNVAGDTMTGDLFMGGNDIRNAGHINATNSIIAGDRMGIGKDGTTVPLYLYRDDANMDGGIEFDVGITSHSNLQALKVSDYIITFFGVNAYSDDSLVTQRHDTSKMGWLMSLDGRNTFEQIVFGHVSASGTTTYPLIAEVDKMVFFSSDRDVTTGAIKLLDTGKIGLGDEAVPLEDIDIKYDSTSATPSAYPSIRAWNTQASQSSTYVISSLDLQAGNTRGMIFASDGTNALFNNAFIFRSVNNDIIKFLHGTTETANLTSAGNFEVLGDLEAGDDGIFADDGIFGGVLGVGRTPTEELDVYKNQNAGTIALIENDNAGASAYSAFRANSDVAQGWILSHASGRTVSRYGQTLGGWVEFYMNAGNGLALGTNQAVPLVLGTSSTEAIYIGGGDQNVRIGTGYLTIKNDDKPLYVGASNDASYQYNGSDALYNSQEQGSGHHIFQGGNVEVQNNITQDSGNFVISHTSADNYYIDNNVANKDIYLSVTDGGGTLYDVIGMDGATKQVWFDEATSIDSGVRFGGSEFLYKNGSGNLRTGSNFIIDGNGTINQRLSIGSTSIYDDVLASFKNGGVNTQINFRNTDVDGGGYLVSVGNDQATLTGGTKFNSSNKWEMMDENAEIWQLDNGEANLYLTTNQTIGSEFDLTKKVLTINETRTKIFNDAEVENNLTIGGQIHNWTRILAYLSADQTTSNSADQQIFLDTESYDTLSEFDTSTGNATLKQDGVYTITNHVAYTGNAVGRRRSVIKVNNGFEKYEQVQTPSAGTAHVTVTVTRYYPAGTIINLHSYQNSGGNLNVLGGDTISTTMEIVRVQ